MINKDMLIKYVRIISGYEADPNLTLVDFSLNEEQRNIVNLVNDEAKKDKRLANLLEDLKYSNKKMDVIEKYFDNNEEKKSNLDVPNSRFNGKDIINNYGFINMASLVSFVGIVTLILAMVITFGTR